MNVPKLRFKEFNDEWQSINLATIFQYFATNSFSRDQLSESGILKNLHYGDIHRKYNSIVNENDEITSYIKDINYDNKYELLKNNDLIFADASEDYEGIGKAVEVLNVNNKTISGLHTILARDNLNVFAPMFKGYYFNSPIVHNQLRVLANGFKVYGISKDSINKLNIKVPSTNEQTKIANTLYLLDKKIELQSKKIEDLKLFKLCINNILFNGNKTIKLKDICECKSSTISLSDIEYDDGMYPIYGANGEIKKINSYQNDKDYLAIIKDGAGVGKTIICNKKSSIIATLSALIPNGIPVYYFNELINKIDFSKYIVGSGIPHIYFKDYSNEKLYLHEEKKRVLINNLFKRIIIKIELEENKLHLLETVKKGLMQSMFV